MRPTIGLDFDDVLAPFDSLAIKMANDKYGFNPPLTLEEITDWDLTGRVGVIREFFEKEELYQSQEVSADVQNVVRNLMEIADVYFISAVYPKFMSIRALQILNTFPEITPDKIILGSAKDKVHFDIVLDDAIHNILESPAEYPVLMRRPWNRNMTGLLAVNNMNEFYIMVKQILKISSEKKPDIVVPSVLAIVGPSGSGKTEIVNKLVDSSSDMCKNPIGFTTKPDALDHKIMSEEEFDRADLFEKTMYAGYKYGMQKSSIEEILKTGKFAVYPVDMCGAIALKRYFPTEIIYVKRDKEKLIRNIIEENNMDIKEKTLRILSLDTERKNSKICDYRIDNNDGQGADAIISLIHKTRE